VLGILTDLYRYRAFVCASITREVQSQYLGSVFGFAWVFINPLVMLGIYTVIFSGVMGNRLPGATSVFSYSVYLCAGLLPWGFITDGISRLTQVFVAQGGLIKKASFPRICLPAIALGVAGFNFAVIFSVFLVFLLAIGAFPGWVVLLALPALAVQLALMLGFGILLETLNVFFRDVGQFVGITFQLLFWFTPIVYPLSALPPLAQSIVLLNPFTALVQFYQAIFLYGRVPDAHNWLHVGAVAALALIGLVLGMITHRRHAADMAEEL